MKSKSTIRFDEDSFDLEQHKRTTENIVREKKRIKNVHSQIKRGKIILGIVTIAIFFGLFYLAAKLGLMQIF